MSGPQAYMLTTLVGFEETPHFSRLTLVATGALSLSSQRVAQCVPLFGPFWPTRSPLTSRLHFVVLQLTRVDLHSHPQPVGR